MCSRGSSSAGRGRKTQDRLRTGARTVLLRVLPTAHQCQPRCRGREPARPWREERHVAVCHKALRTSDTPKPPDSEARERWGQAGCGELLGFQFKASEGVEKSRLSWICLPVDQE